METSFESKEPVHRRLSIKPCLMAVFMVVFAGCAELPQPTAQSDGQPNEIDEPQSDDPVGRPDAVLGARGINAIARPDVIETRLDFSEYESGRATAVLRQLCAVIEGRASTPFRTRLTSDFAARWPQPVGKLGRITMGTGSYAVAGGPDWLNADAFLQRLGQWSAQYREIVDCRLKHYAFELAKDRQSAFAKAHFLVHAIRTGGGRRAIYSDLEIAFTGPEWRIQGIDWVKGQITEREEAAFRSVGSKVGASQFASQESKETLLNQVDAGTLETMGGLGIIDWNQDGRDDILSWIRGRGLQVLVNDGVSGFNTQVNLIPPDHVGLSHLYVDLDRNGRADLVTTEVGGCNGREAWFPIYERAGDGFEIKQATLKFASSCTQPSDMRFQHIQAADVDLDGDLDLFFSGFEEGANAGHSRTRQNVFRATNGLGNLLFINHGGLNFVETAQPNGFDGRSYSYGSTFLDVDDDGLPDLYVVNDYGPNTLYKNLGQGQFKKTILSPLTDNGQSMGLTVADLTGDGEWDLYISNMYSHAGQRIVPLTRSDFQPEEHKELLRLAGGNALYTKGQGAYQDVASSLGLAQAGWAWGQAVFDLENDGDWDVYVVNGNTSHRDARAPDY